MNFANTTEKNKKLQKTLNLQDLQQKRKTECSIFAFYIIFKSDLCILLCSVIETEKRQKSYANAEIYSGKFEQKAFEPEKSIKHRHRDDRADGGAA